MISYDIADDTTRCRVYNILKNYGERIQYSVFECNLTDLQVSALQREIKEDLEPETDSIRVYALCSSCSGKI